MMRMRKLLGLVALGFGAIVDGSLAVGQTVERDTTITGPRGRSIKRQVEVQRGPGGIDRSVQIQRPGGTFDRQVQVHAHLRGDRRWVVHGRALPGFRGRSWSAPPAPAFGFGLMAAPMLNFSFGGGGGGMLGGPGGPPPGGPGPGGPGGPAGGPPQPPDQVALMTQRLQSFYSSHRKDAAYTLGRLHDPRDPVADSCPEVRLIEGRSDRLGDRTGRNRRLRFRRRIGAVRDLRQERRRAQGSDERARTAKCPGEKRSTVVIRGCALSAQPAPAGHVKAFAVPGIRSAPA